MILKATLLSTWGLLLIDWLIVELIKRKKISIQQVHDRSAYVYSQWAADFLKRVFFIVNFIDHDGL
jgi:hypothetical protein